MENDEIVETNTNVEKEIKPETNDMKNDEIVPANATVEEDVNVAEAIETNDMKNDDIVEDTIMKDKEKEEEAVKIKEYNACCRITDTSTSLAKWFWLELSNLGIT